MSAQKKGRQRLAAGRNATEVLEADIAGLVGMPIHELRKIWVIRIGSGPPSVRSPGLIRRLLAWQLQADSHGGVDATTARKLRDIANAIERDGAYEPKIRRDLSPGVVLTREWKGVVHKVTVMAAGFQYQGKRYKSLSNIARTIAGTRWSGPRFFGLEQKKVAKIRGTAS
jgi:hypothetical protein